MDKQDKKLLIVNYYAKIDELKAKLKTTDYRAIKYAEGEITASEYAPTLEARRKIRAQINALETDILALQK